MLLLLASVFPIQVSIKQSQWIVLFVVSSSQFYLLSGGLQIPANAKLEL